MGLGVASLHAVVLTGDDGELVVVLADELADGLLPVAHEGCALFGRAYGSTREDGQPGMQVVAATLGELFEHGGSPRLGASLVAVGQHILDTTLTHQTVGCLAVHVEIGDEVLLPSCWVELIDFEACGFRRSRMVHLACKRPTKAIDAPSAFGGTPVEFAVCICLAGDVEHILCVDLLAIVSQRHGHHSNVFIMFEGTHFPLVGSATTVANRTGGLVGCRQWTRDLATALYVEGLPNEFLHGILRLYPWSTCGTPSGCRGDSHFEP